MMERFLQAIFLPRKEKSFIDIWADQVITLATIIPL
jgi:hypothetical protein